MSSRTKLTNQERYEKYDKLAEDKCRVDHRRSKQTNHGTVAPHGGEIVWIDDGSIGIQCCDSKEILVLGEIDAPTKCPVCGCRLYAEIDVKIMRVLQC